MKAIANVLIFSFLLLSVNCFAAKPKLVVRGKEGGKYSDALGGSGPGGHAGISVPLGGSSNNCGGPCDPLFSGTNTQNGSAAAMETIERMISGSNLNNNQKNHYRQIARQAIRELAAAESQRMSKSAYKRKVQQILNKYKSMPEVRSRISIKASPAQRGR